jgi:hypothetical protein
MRCVSGIPLKPARGSTLQLLPMPPSQPNVPTLKTSSRRVTTAVPKPQPMLSNVPERDRERRLLRGEPVGRHQLDRSARQHPCSAVLAVVEHHLPERG